MVVTGTPAALWSLWTMLRFYADRFHTATNLLSELRSFVAQIPQQADGAALHNEIAKVASYLADLRDILGKLDLGVSLQNIEYLHERLTTNPIVDSDFRSAINMSFRLLNNELKLQLFLYVSRHDKELFEQTKPLFGIAVDTQFPCLTDEIGEAGKCLALERGTAAAFHSIRCLEAGIRAMSRCLGIPDPTRASGRNWGALLKSIKDEVDRRWPGSSSRMRGDGEFFDNAYAALAAMQNPWRNATMHLDQKYTPEEARTVFETVKGFMQKIASRCDENGLPKA
jgi:hypothetical protein